MHIYVKYYLKHFAYIISFNQFNLYHSPVKDIISILFNQFPIGHLDFPNFSTVINSTVTNNFLANTSMIIYLDKFLEIGLLGQRDVCIFKTWWYVLPNSCPCTLLAAVHENTDFLNPVQCK